MNPGDRLSTTAEQVRAVFDGESPREISAQ